MTRKVAISVPDDLLAAVDAESNAAGTSRSRVFGLAARTYLDRRRRQRDVDRYLASYRELPESDEEVAATDAFLRRSCSE
ncbi:MAG: ribbon-helix-helix protein, CopG family [Candidatus Dormibacteraeota bacterium]|uniref:Ribbon-helix-helix protein, CopG family n=1 Tax=Candidatus Amunia macphersoniae TaxID=3127014 RepID=A0A934KLV5_9BACT|nr:ribbon-helix-helix protein, CopG family [Candidatus Dormibacteraeota bacterium]